MNKEKIIKIKEKTMKILQNTLMTLFFSTQVWGSELNMDPQSQTQFSGWRNFVSNLLENPYEDFQVVSNNQTLKGDYEFLRTQLNFSNIEKQLFNSKNKQKKIQKALIRLGVLKHPKIIESIKDQNTNILVNTKDPKGLREADKNLISHILVRVQKSREKKREEKLLEKEENFCSLLENIITEQYENLKFGDPHLRQ